MTTVLGGCRVSDRRTSCFSRRLRHEVWSWVRLRYALGVKVAGDLCYVAQCIRHVDVEVGSGATARVWPDIGDRERARTWRGHRSCPDVRAHRRKVTGVPGFTRGKAGLVGIATAAPRGRRHVGEDYRKRTHVDDTPAKQWIARGRTW